MSASLSYFNFVMVFIVLETKNEEEDDLPSMETLEISKGRAIQSIPSYFGGEEEDDIPDMADFDDSGNLVEPDDPVCFLVFLLMFLDPLFLFYLMVLQCF